VADLLGIRRFADVALDAGLFLDGLYVEAKLPFFRYIPGECAFVHNANLWAAAMVAEAARRLGDARMKRRAVAAARHSVSMQRKDGSWSYGALSHHGFVDSFHSGYNLEALSRLNTLEPSAEWAGAIERGLRYFRCTFIEPDGAVRYYHDRRYPLDAHCAAQAILTLLAAGEWNDLNTCRNIATWSLRVLYVPRLERFAYQRHRFIVNRVCYLRWTQAWMYRALAALLRRLIRQ
jgi:hypothetical protein